MLFHLLDYEVPCMSSIPVIIHIEPARSAAIRHTDNPALRVCVEVEMRTARSNTVREVMAKENEEGDEE